MILKIKQHRFKQNPLEEIIVEEFINQYSKNEQMDLIVFGA